MAQKASEWYFGLQHDEILAQTLRARERAQRRLEAKISKDKGGGDQAKARGAKIAVTDLARVLKEHINHRYDDIFDAFTDVDLNGNGTLSKAEFRQGIEAMGPFKALDNGKFTKEQLDDLFELMDSKSENKLRLEHFIKQFDPEKTKAKRGRDEKVGQKLAGKGAAAQGLTEVIMECKDESGIEQSVPVKIPIKFESLLQQLHITFKRPVTFMYEDVSGHQFTVKNASDLAKCWASVTSSGKGDGVKHLECMIVDFEAATQKGSSKGRGRPSLSERREGVAKVHGTSALDNARDPVESIDFRGRHKWIDDMMRLLGAPLENEPAVMHNKWEILIKECEHLDISKQSTVSVEGFRNALGRTEPQMTPEDVEWFVKDADKDANGDVLYEAYARTKKQGQVAGKSMEVKGQYQSRELTHVSERIHNALKSNFKSLQQAFKRMDQDRDGRLSREEFRKGVQQRLKLNLPTRLLDEVIRKVDKGSDGYIDYEDFLAEFNQFQHKDVAGRDDGLGDDEISVTILGATLNIAEIFKKMDDNGDGVLSLSELQKGLSDLGIKLGKSRVTRYMASMDIDGNKSVDYREFLRRLSTVQLRDLSRVGGYDKMTRLEDIIKNKLREEYDDAKQAFHNLDKDADGRLSEEEFIKGILALEIADVIKDEETGEEIKFSPPDSREGTGKVHWDQYDDDEPRVELLRNLFLQCNSSGDGYLAYHEFLFRFPIRPKPLQLTVPFDQELRSMLRKQFASVTDAFVALDVDRDNRISKEDLMKGLQTAGLFSQVFADPQQTSDLENKIEGLVARAATADKKHIDYYDFIVRFGLDSKADGRWVYKERSTGAKAKPFEDLAEEWRKLIPQSKWYGRGGIKNTLMRFDDSKTGEMSMRLFTEALRDGLMMSDKLDTRHIQGKEGFIVGRPWTTEVKDKDAVDKFGNKLEPTINIEKFMSMFIDVYFERDRVLFDVLLVQNRWLDFKNAFNSCSSVLGEKDDAQVAKVEAKLISKADFGHALQTLVEKGKLTERERSIVLQCCETDSCFIKRGKYVGYIDYEVDFLQHYIADEMEIYEKVFKHWERCDKRFYKMGSALTYIEFEALIRDEIGGPDSPDGLRTDQIAFLIDVVDKDGDGTVGRSEFVERYAREDAVIQQGLKSNWYNLMTVFKAENKKTVKDKTKETKLSGESFNKCLQEGLKNGHFGQGKVTSEQLADIVTNIDQKLKDDKTGMIDFELFLRKYVENEVVIHKAFAGIDEKTKMPRWDAVIARFEMLDRCRSSGRFNESDHRVPWDHFRKALRLADIKLDPAKVQVIIDTLDVNMTGMVCWTDMVKGPVAPYFFDGKEDYEMRSLLCDSTGGWPLIYEKCKEREKMVRRLEKGLLPDRAHGVLPAKYFEECLTDTPALNLRDDPKTKLMLKKIVSTCEGVPTGQGAFLKEGPDGTKIKDRNDKTLIDYEKVCRHYAGASFDAEREFERKWEVVIEVLKELKDANIGRQLSRETFKMRLSDSALHISDATIDFLLRDQPAATVDMDAICWRTAKSTILKILKIKWSLLMQLFRIKDPHNKMRLSKEVVQQILDRADVGMSTSLVEILMSNLLIEDDGKIDYDKLLSGKLKSGSFPMDVYTAYKTMETEWETLSTHFWEYDLNGDGLVDHEEFKMALRSLQHPALSDASVISDLIKHLDPDGDPDAKPPTDNIDFDRFSWNMARGDLKQVVDQRGNDVLKAFRKEATRLFDKHKGFLPVKDSIEAIHRELADLNVKPILVKILVSRAESFRLEGANKKGTERKTSDAQPLPATAKMLTEEHLLSTLREVSGDIFKKAEESRLRDSFMDILHASKLETVDKWRLKGEDGIEIKTLWGAASLGPDAMRYVGQVPYKRLYLHPFLDQGGKNMLESMKASPRLVQIKEDRVQTIYSRDPWISFWQQRSKYRSPAMATPNVSTSTRGAAAPRAQQPGGSHAKAPMASMAPLASSSTNTAVAVGSGKKTEEADIPWQRVCQKVKKAAFDRFHTNAEAIASLDPENSGAGAIATQTLRQALEGLVLSLSASELDMITEKLDAGHDGMVLKSDIAHYLLPEDTNRRVLERLAAERHARGVYARLRTRQGQGPSPDAHSATSAGRNVRPEASGAGERWDVPDPYEYQYRFAWNRVQHPQSYPSSHFGAAGSAGTDLQAARPIAHPAASGHPQSAIGIGPRAPSPSHGASLVPGYLPSERGGGRDSSRPALYHSAPSSTLTRYMAAGPRYPSPTVGSQPVTSSQQQPPSQFWGPGATSQGSSRLSVDLDGMYRSTMEQLMQLQMSQ